MARPGNRNAGEVLAQNTDATIDAFDVTLQDVNRAAFGSSANPIIMSQGAPTSATDVTATGTLGALNNAVTISTKGLATVVMEADAGLVGTVIYEVTVDDTNWVNVFGYGVPINSTWASQDATLPIRRQFAVAGTSQFRARCSVYTSGSSAVRLRASIIPVISRLAPGGVFITNTPQDGTSNAAAWPIIASSGSAAIGQYPYAFNASAALTWDRVRNNYSIAALASGARTTTQTGADITTYNARYLKVILDMTVVGTGSVTLTIQGKAVAGTYYTLLAGAAVITNVTNVYEIGPGLPATANVSANTVLPRTIRLVVTANNANSATYSLDYDLSV